MCHEERKAFKNHLPEERGILYHSLTAPAFLDTHLRSRVGVHLSEKGSDTGQAALFKVELLWVNRNLHLFAIHEPELNLAQL